MFIYPHLVDISNWRCMPQLFTFRNLKSFICHIGKQHRNHSTSFHYQLIKRYFSVTVTILIYRRYLKLFCQFLSSVYSLLQCITILPGIFISCLPSTGNVLRVLSSDGISISHNVNIVVFLVELIRNSAVNNLAQRLISGGFLK